MAREEMVRSISRILREILLGRKWRGVFLEFSRKYGYRGNGEEYF